jgi:DNA-binding FrmR family transcriptional regulator
MNSLIAQLLEDHMRCHVVDPDKNPSSKQSQGARELIDIINAYLK